MIGKRFLPKSLFGRTLLILVLPTVLIQLVMAYVFFDRHWESVMRQMSKALAGEAAFLVKQLARSPDKAEWQVIRDFENATGVEVDFEDKQQFDRMRHHERYGEFQQLLRQRIEEPFKVRRLAEGNLIEVHVLLGDQALVLRANIKRLESRTTLAFVIWMLTASTLFLFIATLFLRNQVRPIHRLAEAADSFGRGVEMPDFRPHGATEVRKAAKAFIVMRERLKRQIRTRTDMLSGISHDLRTPLTRMKLQLAMMEGEAAKELENDVRQMEHMIAEYLDFARGEGREEAVRTDVKDLLIDVVGDYQRMGKQVALREAQEIKADIRPSAMRRMLHNIIDNALHHGGRCDISLMSVGNNYYHITIDDDGPGIPQHKREEAFKPFARLDPSRNLKTGGVGLGLTIARDVALAHGGNIALDASPAGGLRVVISLPL